MPSANFAQNRISATHKDFGGETTESGTFATIPNLKKILQSKFLKHF